MIFYLALAVVVPLIYVQITHHVWEDFLITFRHSKNLVEGKGLVYNPGQRVQGFTSAINVMLPAIFYALSNRSEEAALNLYRGVSLIAYVIGGWICLRMIFKDRGVDRFSVLFFILLYATEAKTIAFTMNGQECAFMILFLSLGFAVVYRGISARWWIAALSWAGLLYTRPDSFIYIAALGVTALIFDPENRRGVFTALCKSVALALVIYLPWLIFTWIYYGQPIPNTVLAKSSLTLAQVENPARLLQVVLRYYPITSAWIFEPIYAYMGGWPESLLDSYGMGCSIICTIYWLIPSNDRLGRLASFMFTLSALYLSFVASESLPYPWYLPSAALFGTIMLARAPVQILGRIPVVSRGSVLLGRLLQTAIVAVSVFLFAGETYQMSIQQREIEDNSRKLIGLYLHDVVRPDQKIFLEPIGYIGYYSDRFIIDWPGLVSPEVVRLHHDRKLEHITSIPVLMPEWLVLRGSEAEAAFQIPSVSNNYVVVRVFDVRPNLDRYSYIPGAGYVYVDSNFYVLRRKDVQPAS